MSFGRHSSGVSTLFLMENTGLKVNEVNELRSQVRKTEATYKVVKNTVVQAGGRGHRDGRPRRPS